MQSIPLVSFHNALRQGINAVSEQQAMEEIIDIEIDGAVGNTVEIANALLIYASSMELAFNDISLFHRDIRHVFNERQDGKFVVNTNEGILGITLFDAWVITRQAIMLVPEGEDPDIFLGNRNIIPIYRVEIEN